MLYVSHQISAPLYNIYQQQQQQQQHNHRSLKSKLITTRQLNMMYNKQ
jgi:hypothetical protein